MQSARQLTLEIARQRLARAQQGLRLNEFEAIDDDAAILVASYHGDLSLNGITKLSDAGAEALATHKGSLSLNGLTRLSEKATVALGKHDGKLFLKGLRHLSLLTLSPNVVTADIWKFTSIGDDAADWLSRVRGRPWDNLILGGLTHLSDTAALSLSKCERDPSLSGLTTLSDTRGHLALADRLSQSSGVDLRKLTNLSDAAAWCLSRGHRH